MAAYNSAIHSNQDDTDVTIINQSLLYDQNDEPISTCLPVLRRLRQAIQPTAPPHPLRSNKNQDAYVLIDREPFRVGKELEAILDFYRKELKQESNSQLDCSRQLITRLIDFIRPIYSNDATKIRSLDVLSSDISVLLDKRCIDEKDKHEQLQTKIRHLRKSIATVPLEDDSRHSLMANLYRMNSIASFEQWADMEAETRKLHTLVQTQRNQIDTLIELLSEPRASPTYDRHSLSSLATASADNSTKACSLCDFEFPNTFTYEQIIGHFETCLATGNANAPPPPSESRHLPCPYCNRKLPDTDHQAYLEHVSKCCNNIPDLDG